uniref:Metalloendopeptidase n=1 Tax=Parastrongyloides trichosuri TaxID=131310 RepID=A0A0N4Z5I1_PARTI
MSVNILYHFQNGTNNINSYFFSFLNDFYERNKREILARGYTKFKLPISYYIANETLKANVTKALERFRNQTCLNFTEVNNSSEIKKGNGLIFLCANGCSTLSGKDPNNTRYIYLADGCLTPYGIQSMVGITLGINYEHLRRDRDDYIKLRWSNIPEKFKYIFNNSMFYNVSKSFGVHYNFGSGFQIGPWWYGENARDAFKVKEKIYYDTLGQQSLDFSDYKLVNLYY